MKKKKIVRLVLLIIACAVLVEYEAKDFFELWIPNFSYLNMFIFNLIVGFTYLTTNGIWNINANKFESENFIKYKPKLWYKLLYILLGVFYILHLLNDFNSKHGSINILLLKGFSIIFTVVCVIIYSIILIKKKGDYLFSDNLELKYKIKGNEYIVKYESLKSFCYKKSNKFSSEKYIELTLLNGEKFQLKYNILNIDVNELDHLIKKNLVIYNSAEELNTSSQMICPTNYFYICINYSNEEIILDCDLVAFILSEDEKILTDEHFVFYNNLASPEGSLQHLGDEKLNGSVETMKINLTCIPPWTQKVILFLTSNSLFTTNNSTSKKINIRVQVFNQADNEKVYENFILFDCFSYHSVEIITLKNCLDGWKIEYSFNQRTENLQQLVDIYRK